MDNCPYCGRELAIFHGFNICPKHGQINLGRENFFPDEIANILFSLQETFPLPISQQFSWLRDELIAQHPIGVAWQLRDCFEYLVKFFAIIELAEFFRLSKKQDNTTKSQISELLCAQRGLSFGQWWSILDILCRYFDQIRASNILVFPELVDLFIFNGKRTDIARRLGLGTNNVINWRNRVFGHGVFQREPAWYANEAMKWLFFLCELGERFGATVGKMVIDTQTDIVKLQDSKRPERNLNLSPLLLYMQCGACATDTLLFWDKNKLAIDHWRIYYIDYRCGALQERSQLANVWKEMIGTSLTQFHWNRASYNSQEYKQFSEQILRHFERHFMEPEPYINKLEKWMQCFSKGFCYVQGVGGVGKSYLAQGFAQKLKEKGIFVLTYRICFGQFIDYRTFIVELGHQVRDQLPFRTQEIQTVFSNLKDLRDQFVEFCNEVMEANHLDMLVLIIDGVDELPNEATSVSVPNSIYEPKTVEGLPRNPFHKHMFTPDDIKRLILQAGFKIEKVLGQQFTNVFFNREKKMIDNGLYEKNWVNNLYNHSEEAIRYFSKLFAIPEEAGISKSYSVIIQAKK